MRQFWCAIGLATGLGWLSATPTVCTSPPCQSATPEARVLFIGGFPATLGTVTDPLNLVEIDDVPRNDLAGFPVITVGAGTSLKVHDQNTLQSIGEAPLPSSIVGATNPVLLGDDSPPTEFVSRADGAVTRIHLNAQVEAWSRSLRRAGCGSDTLTAAPLVHLRRRGTSAFKATYDHDVVYVGTSYGSVGGAACTGSSTQNRVTALRASDGAMLWSLNSFGDLPVDVIVGMALDSSRSTVTMGDHTFSGVQQEDTLFITTERTASVFQPSVWAIDVLTGQARWSGSVGRMTVAPLLSTLHTDRLYVMNRAGEVKALRKSDGSEIWSVAETGMLVPRAAALNREGSEQRIGVVDALGRIGLVRDNGSAAEVLWMAELPIGPVPLDTFREPAVRATSTPLMDDSGRLYVGGSDGTVYQIDVDTGHVLANRTVSEDRTASVTQLILVSQPTDLEPAFLAAATSVGDLARFCVPFCENAGGCAGIPAAVDDSYVTSEDTPLSVAAPGVLLNDLGGGASAALIAAPTHGTVSLNADGSFLYSSAANYAGPDAFTYVASTGSSVSNVATVSLTVTPVNDAPVALDGAAVTDQGVPVTGTLAATDVDGPSLTFAIVANGSLGVATMLDAATGAFSYAPNPGAVGIDAVTFVASDGAIASNVATMTVTIAPSVLTILSPRGGEQLVGGATHTMEWTYTGQPGSTVRIELLKGGAVDRLIKPNASIGTGAQGSFSWVVPSDAGGADYRIRVTSTTSASVTATSDEFTILSPTLVVTAPAAGELWLGGTQQVIRWTYTGLPGSRVRIELLSGERVDRVIKANAPVGANGQGTFTWTVPARRLAGEGFRIRVTSTEATGVSGISGAFAIAEATSVSMPGS